MRYGEKPVPLTFEEDLKEVKFKQYSELVHKIAHDVMQTADKNTKLYKNRNRNHVGEMHNRARIAQLKIELMREESR